MKLGRTRAELLDTVSAEEFKQWVAYFSLQNEEYKEDLENKVAQEAMKTKTAEELAQQMRAMLLGLQN